MTTTVGDEIRAARRAAGLSLRGLADRLGVSAATISALENNKTRVTVERLRAVADVLNLPVGVLIPNETEAGSLRLVAADPPVDNVDAEENWRTFPPLEIDAILAAAIDAFVEIGYHGTTMRGLAERSGLSVPGIYHHYRDKQDLLVRILDLTMTELHWRVDHARRHAPTSIEEVAAIVEALALFHTHRRKLAFIGASEMRSLTGANRRRIVDSRTLLQHILDDAIDRAVADGYLRTREPRTAGRAIATMCTSLPQWFRSDGPFSPQQIALSYVQFALAILHHQTPPMALNPQVRN
ncbi:helix-turn-helix domain-containing protein [Mycolicibacterium goodii]|uniref:Transcriptional regulator n=1 Tax=Mycolicibacterium goodii TaxID=134601 RepID=A0A0K0XET1_MYCGD|nr:transcriptional regulator [Mycolicibacterium goodii]